MRGMAPSPPPTCRMIEVDGVDTGSIRQRVEEPNRVTRTRPHGIPADSRRTRTRCHQMAPALRIAAERNRYRWN